MRPSSMLSVLLTGALVTAALEAGPAAGVASAAPKVTGLSGTSGPLAGGAHVKVHGTGFIGVRTVLVGKATAHVLRATPEALTIVIPGNKAGRVDVRVITAAGESPAVKADRFTYVAPPSVASVTPTQGPAAGGTHLTVKGKNFLHVKAVLFGKAKATKVHVVSATKLTIVAPGHAAGIVDVRVTTAYGTSKSVKADHFTFVATTLTGQPIIPTTPPIVLPTTPPPAPPVAPLVITTSSLPGLASGGSYAGATMAATGGQIPYHWSATGQPLGLTMSAAGALSGISHAVAGLRTVHITVTDNRGTTSSVSLPLNVTQPAGALYAWGSNLYGQTGNGTPSVGYSTTCNPAYAHVATVVAVTGNLRDTYAVKSDGTVWGIGDNAFGQIALPATSTPVTTPAAIDGLSNVTAVAAGSLDAFALTADGKVFGWGDGLLGDGHTAAIAAPVQVGAGNTFTSIAASLYDVYAVRSDGTVLAWGENLFGELGDSGAVNNAFAPQPVPGLTNVVSLVANQYSIFALHRDGTVSAWGANGGGYLGVGSPDNNVNHPMNVTSLGGPVVQLAVGGSTAYALLQDGSIKSWGFGGGGQLGNGGTSSSTTPVSVSITGSAQQIGATSDTAWAILADGSLVAWGGNTACGVGDGTQVERDTPVAMSKLGTALSVGSNPVGPTSLAIRQVRIIHLISPSTR